MPRTRNPYPAEFREQIVALAQNGRSAEELAREFEPCAATIHGWLKQAERDVGHRRDGLTSEERDELRRLRRENRQLRQELTQRRPANVIHHSDQGSQYTSIAFGLRCKEAGVRPSMGSVGDAYDNAMCESFFATLECELLDRRKFQTKAEARMAVFQFIEGWYNPGRRHSALGYKSPINYERSVRERLESVSP